MQLTMNVTYLGDLESQFRGVDGGIAAITVCSTRTCAIRMRRPKPHGSTPRMQAFLLVHDTHSVALGSFSASKEGISTLGH